MPIDTFSVPTQAIQQSQETSRINPMIDLYDNDLHFRAWETEVSSDAVEKHLNSFENDDTSPQWRREMVQTANVQHGNVPVSQEVHDYAASQELLEEQKAPFDLERIAVATRNLKSERNNYTLAA